MPPLMLMLLAAPLPQAAADTAPAPVERSREAVQQPCPNGEYQRTDTGAVVVRRQTREGPSTSVTRGAATLAAGDLMFRRGDPVQMTLLLERRIGQCSVPISYDLTGPGGALPSFSASAPAGDNR